MSSFPSADNFEVGEVYTKSNGESAIVGYTYDGGYGETNQSGGAAKTRTVSYMRNGKRISYKVDAKTGRKVSGKKASPKRRSPKARKTWLPYDEGAVHDGVTSLSSKSANEKKKLMKQAMTYFLLKRMGGDDESVTKLASNFEDDKKYLESLGNADLKSDYRAKVQANFDKRIEGSDYDDKKKASLKDRFKF